MLEISSLSPGTQTTTSIRRPMPLRLDSLILDPQSSDPSAPSEGSAWYRDNEEELVVQMSSGAQVVGRRDNLAGTASPTVGDDINDGYVPGSIWVDTTSGVTWVCMINTVVGAEWRPINSVSVQFLETGQRSFTSTSWASTGNLSVTVPVVGTYLVSHSATIWNDDANDQTQIAISSAGSSTTPQAGLIAGVKRGNNANDYVGSIVVRGLVSVVSLAGNNARIWCLNRVDAGTGQRGDPNIHAQLVGSV